MKLNQEYTCCENTNVIVNLSVSLPIKNPGHEVLGMKDTFAESLLFHLLHLKLIHLAFNVNVILYETAFSFLLLPFEARSVCD